MIIVETAFERWCREDADRPDSTPPPYALDRLALMTLQGTWWVDQHGAWRRLGDMEPSHRRRLLDQLRKRALTWFWQWIEDVAPGASPIGALEYGDGQWIERLPLVRALAAFGDEVTAPVVA